MADDLVTLTSYRFAAKAELVKELLADAGIQAFVADAAMVTNDWFLGNAIGYVKLQVAESQLAAAQQILKEHPEMLDAAPAVESDDGSEQEAADGPVACLSCGAPMGEEEEKCKQCGWTYEGSAE
jgi:hypothetical protein